jgi:conjugative transfer signal peptidase TraF
MVRTRVATLRVSLVISGAATLVWFGPVIPVGINWSSSAPLGLYSRHKPSAIAKDDLVVVCLGSALASAGRARGYLPAGSCPDGTSPVLKQVISTAGDEIELRSDAILVNGRIVHRSPPRSADSLGRPLAHTPLGRRLVGAEEIWVLGVRRERSWDSRYFGAIPLSNIVGVARPLLTLSTGEAR